MASAIAWLDASSAEQRRMRDIIRLFADRDSRDELGLGQVRDALGDILFPGTSTLHSRARYLLFIPWIYQSAAERGRSSEWVASQERMLINSLKDSSDFAGLLGMVAGKSLKTLPSSIYWAALGTYGIRVDSTLTRERALEHRALHPPHEEGDQPHRTVWSPTLPEPPAGFPQQVPGGFALTHIEAAWLRERLLSADPQSLLAHLLDHPPDPNSTRPWLDTAALNADGEARHWLDNAHRFSTVMHGAQLLYNLLLAESHQEHGYAADDEFITRYREALADWRERLHAVDLSDPDAFEHLLIRIEAKIGRVVHPRSRHFIRDWYRFVRERRGDGLADADDARVFIARREMTHKGALSRLRNHKRLQAWAGGTGAGEMSFRWSYVQRTLGDIVDGLAREPEVAVA